MGTFVTTEHDGAVALVTIDNPPMNALSGAVVEELEAEVGRLDGDAGTRAIVLRGAGERAFVAGADIKEFPALREAGGTADGKVVGDDPIEALSAEVSAVDGREAIILTRSHVVSEFFHLDWTSRARRKIGVPVLHLLEHENFDEQAGSGEGVTGL